MKEPPGRERYLTKAEAGRLISVARDMRGGEMLADFIEVAVNTGCRRGELYGLAWSRVDLARGQESITLRSTHTKSGKPRTVPLNQPAAAAMRRRAEWGWRMHLVASGHSLDRAASRSDVCATDSSRRVRKRALKTCAFTT